MPENIIKTDFYCLIKEIEDKKILLPDFQREFVWTKEEQQKKLVASVLSKMPIGSILLLKSPADEYSSKMIGRKEKVIISKDEIDNVKYLLDGQQRLTVLSNVFSNVIYDDCEISDVKYTSLKKRFFLKLPKVKNKDEQDLFGARILNFPYQQPDKDIPDFLSGDIFPFIEVRSFNSKDDLPYNPRLSLDEKLDKFCVNDDKNYYLVPLFLIIPTGTNARDNIGLRYDEIIEEIAKEIKKEIKNEINNVKVYEQKENILKEIFNADYDIGSILNNSEKLDTELDKKAKIWGKNFKKFVESCVKQMDLMQIIVEASQRDRAIDIYENLNRGGVSLSTFDLVMARVAKVSKDNFYDRIVKGIKAPKTYNAAETVLPDKIRNIFEKYKNNYNASKAMGCYNEKNEKNELAHDFVKIFLNVLSLYCNNKDLIADKFKIDYTKRKAILKIKPEDIDENCEKVLDAIDKALFFLQTRCGIRNITEENYSLIIVLIAMVFIRPNAFEQRRIHDLLDAWYWSVLFSGEFDKDQNNNLIRNLKFIYKTIEGEKNVDWIRQIKENIFNRLDFSDKELILLERVEDRLPKEILIDFICQYQLSQPYHDMLSNNIISTFSDENLEAHHIMPLGSATSMKDSSDKLRKNKEHICNSPINFVYIPADTNKKIGAKSLKDYINEMTSEAKSDLHLTKYNSVNISNKEADIREFLSGRLEWLDGKIRSHIDYMLAEGK